MLMLMLMLAMSLLASSWLQLCLIAPLVPANQPVDHD
jgi:hypothetical protein